MARKSSVLPRRKMPNADKLAAVSEENRIITNFLVWLSEQEIVLASPASYDAAVLLPVMRRPDQLLAEFFGIDLNALETERRVLLADLRHAHHTDDADRKHTNEVRTIKRRGY